jgi:transposase
LCRNGEIEAQLRPFAAAVELLCTIPGVQRRTAEALLAEIGPDMSRFPSDRQLASWAGQCPGNDRSAGKSESNWICSSRTSRWARIADTISACWRSK